MGRIFRKASNQKEPAESYTQDNGPDYKREYNLVSAEFQNKNFGFWFVVSGFWFNRLKVFRLKPVS